MIVNGRPQYATEAAAVDRDCRRVDVERAQRRLMRRALDGGDALHDRRLERVVSRWTDGGAA